MVRRFAQPLGIELPKWEGRSPISENVCRECVDVLVGTPGKRGYLPMVAAWKLSPPLAEPLQQGLVDAQTRKIALPAPGSEHLEERDRAFGIVVVDK